MAKIKICGPSTLQGAVMKKAWKEAKERERKGEYVELGPLMSKHRKVLKSELKKAGNCIEIDV